MRATRCVLSLSFLSVAILGEEGLTVVWWIVEHGGLVDRTGERDAEGHDPEVRRFYCLPCSYRRRSADQVVVNVCRMYQQRVVTGLIVAVLIILILVILYEKLIA
jgi:hypothetical protein